jgi:signal peptidase I
MRTDATSFRWPLWLKTVLIGRNPRRTMMRLAVLVAASIVVFKFVLLPIRVEGWSMYPAYRDRDVNFINRLAYVRSSPKRGDVVAIRLAGTSIMFLKRIVGLPGDTVAFHQGHAVINGKILVEPYVKLPCDWELPPETLGPDFYFVVGDNRNMPSEDHVFGKGSRDRIVGKLLL